MLDFGIGESSQTRVLQPRVFLVEIDKNLILQFLQILTNHTASRTMSDPLYSEIENLQPNWSK